MPNSALRQIFRHGAFVALLLCAPLPARAEGDVALDAFVDSYAAAINSKVPGRIRELVHGASLACLTGDNESFLTDNIAGRFRRDIPASRRVKVEEIAADASLLADSFFPDRFTYPVRPSRKVQIEYDTAPGSSVALTPEIGLEGAVWKEVLPCPKEGTLAWMKAARAEKAQRDAEQARAVEALVARLPTPLRDQLVAMTASGRRIEAIRKIEQDMQVDTTLATLALRALVPIEAPAPGR